MRDLLESLLEDDQVLAVPFNEVVVHLLEGFGVRGRYGSQRHISVVVHINDADSEDLLAALLLAGAPGPELAYPGRFLSGLGEKQWQADFQSEPF